MEAPGSPELEEACEPLPAARVVRVERPIAVERLQRVTNRLCHDPGSELFMGERPVDTLDEGQQAGGHHDVLVSSEDGPAGLGPRLV
jgi:hypothetical protein